MKGHWWLALLPFLIGLLASVIWQLSSTGIPVVRMRIDVATILLIFCGFLSGVLALLFMADSRMQRIRQDLVAQAAEDRRRFLQRLDHELKNPLTAILAGLANLSTAVSASSAKNTLLSVEAQVKRLRDLVADLRKLSDLETRSIENVPIDMTALLEGLVLLAREEIGDNARQLTLTLPRAPWPLPNIQGDWDLLFLAVHNLLQNALKFTSPGDTIEMRAFENGSSVVVEVADTGPGIPEEDLPYVWEELYRAKSARTVPGSGLGLALVRAIVLRHGGEVGLRSRKDEGTVFGMRLPVRESPRR